MKTNRYFLWAIIAFLFVSCTPSQQSKTIEDTSYPVEYPVEYIAQTIRTTLLDVCELYALPEEFLDNFMQMHQQYEGTHPTVVAEFPREWGVVLVERLPEGRELYQIQSQNREWIFLVITSGYGTQRILDILPVAVNLVYQSQDILETEEWTTERESNGTFSVKKKYEWVRSLENVSKEEYETNPQNYLRAKTITDKYFINDSFRFERIVTEDIPDYSAVIFYYKDEKAEDWDETIEMLQALCEDYAILFAEVHDGFDKVALYDYKFNFITELDITPYMNLQNGVVFMKKEGTPKAVPLGSYERMKIELKRYFKIVEV